MTKNGIQPTKIKMEENQKKSKRKIPKKVQNGRQPPSFEFNFSLKTSYKSYVSV